MPAASAVAGFSPTARTGDVSAPGSQTAPDGTFETLHQSFPGEYAEKDSKGYLIYEDDGAGDVPPGKVTLKLSEHTVSMMRYGAFPMRLTFEQNVPHPGVYGTPYGELPLQTHTHRLEVNRRSNGEIQVEYTLYMQENPVMHTTLGVRWEERERYEHIK